MGQSSSQNRRPREYYQPQRRTSGQTTVTTRTQGFQQQTRPTNQTQYRNENTPPNTTGDAQSGDMIKQTISKKNQDIIKNLEQIAAQGSHGCELIERKCIPENSSHTYETLFAVYMDHNLTGVRIEDPHLSRYHQFHNLVRFLEVCVLNSTKLRVVHLVIKRGDKPEEQLSCLNDISTSLRGRNILLVHEFNAGIHDRCIVLNNGHLIDLGKGLDIYQKKHKLRFFLGMSDQRLRQCVECRITFFKF